MSLLSTRYNANKSGTLKGKLSDEERFPEMFQPNRKIDRRECGRVVPMKVLVLGMCRTGTACESEPGCGREWTEADWL